MAFDWIGYVFKSLLGYRRRVKESLIHQTEILIELQLAGVGYEAPTTGGGTGRNKVGEWLGGRQGLSAELGGNEKPQPLARGPRASHPPAPCTQLHPSAPPTSGHCTLSSAYRRATEAQIGGATGPGLHSKFTAELSDLCPWPQLCTALGPSPYPLGPRLLWPQPHRGLQGTWRHWPGLTKWPLPPGRHKSPSRGKDFSHTLQRSWLMTEPLSRGGCY